MSSTVTKIPDPLTGGLHHVAVQTAEIDACIDWYEEFLGCTVSWRLDGGYSKLSLSRLPGLAEVAELSVGEMRFHVFTRRAAACRPPVPDVSQFQHVCIRVSSPDQVRRWRARWIELASSGRFRLMGTTAASEIDIDQHGTHSFYATDVNGLEFEFTFIPDGDDVAS